jgi:hypothetical protein
MMDEANGELFLTQEDTKVLFTLLKAREYALSGAERLVLSKIENALYARLSVDEVEALLPRNQDKASDPALRRRGGP